MTFLTTGDKSRVETAERELTADALFQLTRFLQTEDNKVTDLHHKCDRMFPVTDGPWVLRY